MEYAAEAMMPYIRTVLGDIDPSDLGVCYPHEHVLCSPPSNVADRDLEKEVREPLPFLRLIPTGGIDRDNLGAYLKAGAFAVGVGGNLVDKQLVAEHHWTALTERAHEFARGADA